MTEKSLTSLTGLDGIWITHASARPFGMRPTSKDDRPKGQPLTQLITTNLITGGFKYDIVALRVPTHVIGID